MVKLAIRPCLDSFALFLSKSYISDPNKKTHLYAPIEYHRIYFQLFKSST